MASMEHATVYSTVTDNYNAGQMEKEPTDSGIKAVGPVSEEGSNGPMEVKIGESHHVDVKLKQKFSIWSTLGVSYSATSAPIAIGTYLSVVVGVGGSPVFFFGFILCSIFAIMICLVLAEMSAVYPHSSGQIFWTAELAPKKYARGLSYVVGWLASAGWFCWTAACCLITSQLIWALVAICHTSFVILPWHYWIIYLVCVLLALGINWPWFRIYPAFLKMLVIFINVGTIIVMVALLVRAHPKQSAKYVFVDIVNYTGWDSNGVVFCLGLLPGLTAVTAFDAAAHLSEEMPRPDRQVPQVMIGNAVLSAISGLVMILVYMFCVTNTDNLLTPVGGEPIAQLLLDSLDSMALTIVTMLIFILVLLFACGTLMTTFSRAWWAFARDGGVPFSKNQGTVSSRSRLPVNSLLFCTVGVALIGLIELGSAIALNAILGAGTAFLFLSYGVTILAALMGGRRELQKPHYINLGRPAGLIMSVLSVVWVSFITVWLCMPYYMPVTGDYMNYTSPVFAATAIIAALNWVLYSRKKYTTPEPVMDHGVLLTSE
ncbi:hypothetical protein LTS07_004442 [Exophiala sideris]|nr:hypothetical protein LTS07_004442 [Exophiala sideris]KAK5040750.1 hypothetical protein LTR13_003051 [Exophiala sideris]